MIPKIIHYCWFGHSPYPDKVEYCIRSWHEKMPDFEFRLWNEENFDVNRAVFTRQAYAGKQYAFVSDYVRVYALYKYGGFYLDTDIEALKSFDALLGRRVLLGTDESGYLTAFMAAEPGHEYIKELLDHYDKMSFINEDGSYNTTVINSHMQGALVRYGYRTANEYQLLKSGIEVYPDDYFHAKSLVDGKFNVTDNTYCVHHHTSLWVRRKGKLIKFLRMKILAPLLGRERYLKWSEKINSRTKRSGH